MHKYLLLAVDFEENFFRKMVKTFLNYLELYMYSRRFSNHERFFKCNEIFMGCSKILSPLYCAIFAKSATGKIAEFLYNTTPAYGRRYRQDEI